MRCTNNMKDTVLIVGLGNPGKEYQNTRHNAGFCVIDELIKDLGIGLDKKKYNALYTIFDNNNRKYLLVEPQTYMNSSGEAVSKLCNFYKIKNENIIIVYDDMDLPLGKLRLRNSGSSGGHNGVKSIISLMNTDEIKRIRIGISKSKNDDVIDYVLGKFKGEELKEFKNSLKLAKEAIKYYMECEDFDKVMSKYN